MSLIIDQDYPVYSLDMFDTDDEGMQLTRGFFPSESQRVQKSAIRTRMCIA